MRGWIRPRISPGSRRSSRSNGAPRHKAIPGQKIRRPLSKPPYYFEDAASSTAFVVLLFPLSFPLSFRSASLSPVPESLLVPGYPGHDEPIAVRVRSARSVCFDFRLSLSVSTNSSAVRIHRPRHLPRLGPLPAGRLSTSELVGAWGKAPKCNLASSRPYAILSDVTFCRRNCVLRRHRILPQILHVSSHRRSQICSRGLRENALILRVRASTRVGEFLQ